MYNKINFNYSYDDLEPYISSKTIIEHDKLYSRYLNRLNDLLTKNNFKFSIPKEEIFNIIRRFPVSDRSDILFNLGGVLNHELYFSTLTNIKNKEYDKCNIINRKYINIENFKKKFIEKVKEIKGSGYTFLIIDKDKELGLLNLSNQESPYNLGLIPIMNLDLWEHAYYLDYTIDKDKYLKNCLDLIDFNLVDKRYEELCKNIC